MEDQEYNSEDRLEVKSTDWKVKSTSQRRTDWKVRLEGGQIVQLLSLEDRLEGQELVGENFGGVRRKPF